MTTAANNAKIKKQLVIMLIIVVGMFAFCFALVPLYNVICKATGLNGKVDNQISAMVTNVDPTRTITVELLATLNESLPGIFHPKVKKYTIHPGEYIKTSYYVENLTQKPLVVQAIPSVTPGLAARYLKKVECFCFIKQPLQSLEGKEMSLVFTVDPEIPKHIHTLTLAYTLFDVTQH
ncbi:MAG: cytochrome c oxidase assembly protein [Candidatus Berkiellales bacterium]